MSTVLVESSTRNDARSLPEFCAHNTLDIISDDLLAGGFGRRLGPTTRCVEVVSDEHNWPVS